MATGTPATKSKGPDLNFGAVTLSYSNKRPADSILDTPAAEFRTVQGSNLGKRLYFGENLAALAALAKDPAVAGKVKLIYIDPPYATQTIFHSRNLTHAYEDVFQFSEYLEFLRERIIFLHRILAEDGSIYLHIDDKMLFHAKLLLDEVFGTKHYRGCITRKKCNPKNYTRNTYGNVSDYLLFYSKSDEYIWNKQVEPWTEERAKEYQYVDEVSGRRHMRVPVHAPGTRNGETGKVWKGKLPPLGKHWQFTPAVLDQLDAKGEIHWSKNGNPRRKVYLDASDGISVQDIWLDFRDAHNQNVCITGYPTEKNPALLHRIIKASSNPGDLVLDCFAGSGTTLVAADELGRRWIGVDNSVESIRTILSRFIHGTERMGDFVTPPQERTQSLLFGFEECSSESARVERQMIVDFQLLAPSAEPDIFLSESLEYVELPVSEHRP